VEVEVSVGDGFGRGVAPAGASRGRYEVVYFPNDSVDECVSAFEKYAAPELLGMDAAEQVLVDRRLEEVDGTERFERIGGAAAIAASVASARAAASAFEIPMFQHLGGVYARYLPLPLGNVIGGGKHSRGLGPDIQEFLVIPLDPPDMFTALEVNVAIHREVLKELVKADPTFTGGRNDEGAWTPRISAETALRILTDVARRVGERYGVRVGVGVDMASSSLWDGEKYVYRNEGVARSPREQLEYVTSLIERFDLVYVEDPFHEDDFDSFAELAQRFGDRLIVGDDLFVTNAERIAYGGRNRAATGVIIKPDQTGTLTRAREAVETARRFGLTPIVSHRSGESESDWLAHVAVGFSAPVIKSGVVGGERVAKLNELLRIWDYLGSAARMARL